MKRTYVTIIVSGQRPRKVVLDESCPTFSCYVENEDFAQEQDAGLSEEERKIAVMVRSATALFMSALQTAADLEELDPEAAAELWDAFGLSDPEDQSEE